uniref:MADF domain-containing protein n=1 Tax=Ditylenchus dipsaci TaxID=166011 RepID=A0A915CU16_9BILA
MRPKTYLLAKAIQERKDILFGNVDAVFKPQGLKEKEEAWEAIRAEMIENGFTNFERKSWKDVRNHDWQYLRRSAVSKFEHNQKPGNEPIQYNEVDRVVFDIMGNETSSCNDNSDNINLSSPAFDFFNGSIDLSNDANKPLSDADTMENLLAAAARSSLPCTSSANVASSSSNPVGMSSAGLNIPLMDHQQQQLSSLFNSVVNRKTSWDTNSSTESSKEVRRSMNNESEAINEYSKLLNGACLINLRLQRIRALGKDPIPGQLTKRSKKLNFNYYSYKSKERRCCCNRIKQEYYRNKQKPGKRKLKQRF